MPRGIPANGIRMTAARRAAMAAGGAVNFFAPQLDEPVVVETDEEISSRINDRFEVLHALTEGCVEGSMRAVIASGPGGLGKSFTVEKVLEEWDPMGESHTIVKGFIRPTGLYRLLYQYKDAGKVIVLDDVSGVFEDETCLNLLKAACDTTDTRKICWGAETKMIDEDNAELLPRSFTFEGAILVLTNTDFEAAINRGSKISAHLEAMMSRAHYLDLGMKSRRDYMVRIMQVVKSGILENRGLEEEAQQEVIDFIRDNQDKMKEMSLRAVIKLGNLRRLHPTRWVKFARTTMLR